MRPSRFDLKWKFLFLTVIVVFSSSIIKSYNDYQTDLELIEIAEKAELNFVKTLIQSTFNFELKNDAQMASLVAKMPPIIQAVKEKNKADLIRMTDQMMKVQHDAYALGNAEFSVAPGNAFHNVYMPARSEGGPKEQSDLVLQTIQKNESLEGIELVYDGISIRGAAPLEGEDNKAAGSFILAIDIQEPLNSIKEITGFEVGVLINSDSWLTDGPGSLTAGGGNGVVIGGQVEVAVSGTQAGKPADFTKIAPVLTPNILKTKEGVKRAIEVGGKTYGCVVIPLFDFRGWNIGSFVAVKEFDYYTAQLKANLIRSILESIFQMILLTGCLYFILTYLLFNKLSEIPEELSHIHNPKQLEECANRCKFPLVVPLIVISIIVISTFFGIISYYAEKNIVVKARDKTLNTIVQEAKNYLEILYIQWGATASLVVELPQVGELMKRNDRTGLYTLLDEGLKAQKDRFGVSQATFYTQPAIEFLQMYDPKNYGKNDDPFASIVLKAFADGKFVQGMELNPNGPALQAVDLVRNQNEVVGAFALATDWQEIIYYLSDNFGIDVGVYVNQKKYAAIADKVITEERKVGNFVLIRASDYDFLHKISPKEVLSLQKKPGICLIDGTSYGLITMPLLDVNGNSLGFILLVANFHQYDNLLTRALITEIYTTALQILFLIAVLIVTLRTYCLAPMEFMQNELLKLIGEGRKKKGEFDEWAEEKEKAKEEGIEEEPEMSAEEEEKERFEQYLKRENIIGKIAEEVEQLQERFKKKPGDLKRLDNPDLEK